MGIKLTVLAAILASTFPPATLTMTQLDANRIIQRTSTTGGGQGKGQGSVVVPITLSAASRVYARRRSVDGSNTILQAPWLVSASATTGNLTVTGIDVPAINSSATAAVATNDGWFYIDLGPTLSGPWTLGTNQVTCGRLTLISGQSLAMRMLAQVGSSGTNSSLSVTIAPHTSILATYNDVGLIYEPTVSTMPWAPPADGGNYTSTFASEFTRRQAQLFGCPAGIIGHAHSATLLAVMIPPSADATTYLAPVIARAGNAFESCIWYQGHTEAGNAVPPGGYAQALTQLFTYFATLSTIPFAKYVGTIPNITSGSLWGTSWCRHWIRAGAAKWCTANSAQHLAFNDIDLYDGVHQSQTGAITMAQHCARATKTELSARGDVGPALLSATRSGTTITAVFSDVGQGNLVLTGTPGNRIFVFPTGRVDQRGNSNNRFPVSSVSVTSKTTLSIVLANDPGDAHVLDLWIYWPNDTSNAGGTDNIRDDITDGDGITVGRQVVSNNTAVTIAAPGSTTTNAPPGGFQAAVSQLTLPETSTTYGAQEQTGFNGTLSGGYAVGTGFHQPVYNPYTVSFFFTAPSSAPAATQYIIGGPGSGWIALTTAMKVSHQGLTSPVLTAGHRYHFYCQATPTGYAMYMTDITAAGSSTLVASNSSASNVLPTGVNWGLRRLDGNTPLTQAGATLDEVAIFDYPVASGSTYTPPAAPFVGNETGIVALYHLDTTCADVVCA